MDRIYPDLEWYKAVSIKQGVAVRCPFATVHSCPRYFESVSLLSNVKITTKMPQVLHDELLEKWENHHLWPVTCEMSTSISGGVKPNCFSNFCPEVSFDIFKLFASSLIMFFDSLDRKVRERQLEKAGEQPQSKDWRWNWEHVEPLHYTECSFYSKLTGATKVTEIHINGPITGQVNVAGENINTPLLSLSLGEILKKIDATDASQEEKELAKSKFKEFLAHPLVASIIGGLVSHIGG